MDRTDGGLCVGGKHGIKLKQIWPPVNDVIILTYSVHRNLEKLLKFSKIRT